MFKPIISKVEQYGYEVGDKIYGLSDTKYVLFFSRGDEFVKIDVEIKIKSITVDGEEIKTKSLDKFLKERGDDELL